MNRNLEAALQSLKNRLGGASNIIICDPYILSEGKHGNNYADLMLRVFPVSLESLTFIDGDKHPNEQLLLKIKQKLPQVKVCRIFCNEIHDRVWIIDSKRGFIAGTSFNSIGTKVSFINDMSDNDFNAFWKLLNQIVILD
jgi:hypothetical protein